jgi:hypothetical protein
MTETVVDQCSPEEAEEITAKIRALAEEFGGNIKAENALIDAAGIHDEVVDLREERHDLEHMLSAGSALAYERGVWAALGYQSYEEWTEHPELLVCHCCGELQAHEEDRVTAEGPFDVAVANGLAAILSDVQPGAEVNAERVLSPTQLLDKLEELQVNYAEVSLIDLPLLREGVQLSQPFRHGRADDEWTRVGTDHVQALVKLDDYRSLRVRELLANKTFEAAVVLCFNAEAENRLPCDPKDRSMFPDPVECPQCWRYTLLADGWDDWGVEVGEGTCIACGYERTYEDTVDDAMRRVAESH